MKADLMDEVLFAQYLREQGLVVSSIKTYGFAIHLFLRDNPEIDNSNSYHKFIVYSMKDKSMYQNFYALKAFIRYKFSNNLAIRNQLLEDLSTKEVQRLNRLKNTKKVFRPLTEEEVVNVLNNFENPKHKIMFLIQLKVGIRCHDVLSITFSGVHYNIEKKELVLNLVTKGDKPRTVMMYGDTAKIINDYVNSLKRGDDDARSIFLTDERKNIRCSDILSSIRDDKDKILDASYKLEKHNYDMYYLDFKQAFQSAGLDSKLYATHYLRRKFARKIWDKYKDAEKLKTGMGHADITTSFRYLRDSGLDSKQIFEDMKDEL